MKNFRSLIAVAFMAIVTISFNACQSSSKTASSTTLLKLNLEKGKGYDYSMIVDMDTKAQGMTATIGMTANYHMNILSIDNGVRTIETAYTGMKMNIDAMGVSLNIDSDKPSVDNGSEDPAKNPLGLMQRMVKSMMNKPFTMKVNEEGKVLEVKGFKEMFAGMFDSMGLDATQRAQAEASMSDNFSEQKIKDQFSQAFYIFPNKEVKVGDSWEKSYDIGGKMPAKYTSTYTVKSIEGTSVSLAVNSKIDALEDQVKLNGTQTGNIVVDSKTGLLVSGQFDQDLKGDANGVNLTVEGKMKVSGRAN